MILITHSKTCLKRPLQKKTKNCFSRPIIVNAGQKYCRILSWSILQYFRPSLSYHLFCLFLSARLRPYYQSHSLNMHTKLYSGAKCLIESAHQIFKLIGPIKQKFSAQSCSNFLTQQSKHMFWVLKRTVPLKRFF